MSDPIERYNAAMESREQRFADFQASLLQMHPSTADLVIRFATAMALKLTKSEQKYGHRDGWADDCWQESCKRQFDEHLTKGDPLDVANYCAFMWHHGWPTNG